MRRLAHRLVFPTDSCHGSSKARLDKTSAKCVVQTLSTRQQIYFEVTSSSQMHICLSHIETRIHSNSRETFFKKPQVLAHRALLRVSVNIWKIIIATLKIEIIIISLVWLLTVGGLFLDYMQCNPSNPYQRSQTFLSLQVSWYFPLVLRVGPTRMVLPSYG